MDPETYNGLFYQHPSGLWEPTPFGSPLTIQSNNHHSFVYSGVDDIGSLQFGVPVVWMETHNHGCKQVSLFA